MSTNTQSHTHQKRVRKLTRLVKSLYPTLAHIPAPLPPVGSEANRIAKNASAKDVTKRKEEFGRVNEKRLDKDTVKYWTLTPDDQPYGRNS